MGLVQTPWTINEVGLPLTENVLKLLSKGILVPLAITAATSAADTGIDKSSRILIDNTNNNKQINRRHYDIMKIVKSLEDSDLLIKGVIQTVENET